MDDEYSGTIEALRSALDASGMVGTWDWDCVNRTAQYDSGAADLLALDRNLAGQVLNAEQAMRGIHPDDRVWLTDAMKRAVVAGGLILSEYRVVKDGEVRWLLTRGRVYQDEFGRPIRCKGILFDITDSRDDLSRYFAQTGDENQHPLDRVAGLLLEARRAVDSLDKDVQSYLSVLLDIALLDVGTQIARRSRH